MTEINGIQVRTILWFVVFFSMTVDMLISHIMPIAIVAMIKQKESFKLNNSKAYVCSYNLPNNSFTEMENKISTTLNTRYVQNTSIWNEQEQGFVLGSYYWLYWITIVPGAILSKKYGTKLIFGLGVLIATLLSFLIPIAVHWHISAVIAIRVFQGILTSAAWPAMHQLTSQWIPPNERGAFLSSYLGASFPSIFFIPLFGYLISVMAWEYIFYLTGLIGILWFCFWQYFLYDSPSKHPRIDPIEREFILMSLGSDVSNNMVKLCIPWRSILTSVPVWMNVCAQFGLLWSLLTLSQTIPIYFKTIHDIDTEYSGVIYGLPQILRIICGILFSKLCDYLLKMNKLSRTSVRKVATIFGLILHGLLVFGIAFSGCNRIQAIAFIIAVFVVNGTESSGPLASLVDLSPNYSGITIGISGIICMLPGFLSPYIVGQLTLNNQTPEQWRYVYLISAIILLVTGVLYQFFSDSTVQPWNSPEVTQKVEKSCNPTKNFAKVL